MSFLGSIGKGIWNAATSPIRLVTNAAKTVGNALLVVKDIVTLPFGGGANLKNDLKDMGKAAVGTVFAGVESVLTYGTFGVGGALLGGARGAATGLVVENAARIGITAGARSGVASAFVGGMIENGVTN